MHLYFLYCPFSDPNCSWLTPTNDDNVLKCNDGTYCNGVTDANRWSCCNSRGMRAKCPKNWPTMCAKEQAAAGGKDFACYENEAKCNQMNLDGVRPC